MINNRIGYTLALSAAILATSCSKLELLGAGNSIKVKVTATDTRGTVTTTDGLKSSGAFSMMAYLSDKYVMREDLEDPDSPLIPVDSTKPVDEGGDPKLFGADDGLYFTGNGNVTLGSGGWSIAPDGAGNPYTWVYDVDTYFWAWHPVTLKAGSGSLAGGSRTINAPTPVAAADRASYPTKDPTDPDSPRSPKTGELTFTYTTPTVDGSTDADRAEDLLFAYSKKKFVKKTNLTESDKTVNITFHHALAQVRFCVSTDDGTFDKSLKIKSISITNLATKGNGSFTDSGNAENNQYAYDPTNSSYDQFVWTGQSNTTTTTHFGQTYNANFSTSTVSGWTKSSYTDDNGTTTTSDDRTYTLYTCQNVFFMIPQKVTSSNKIIAVFDYKGEEIERTIDIADATGVEWLGDHYYTYKIKATTLGRDIDFAVSLVGWSNRKEEIFI